MSEDKMNKSINKIFFAQDNIDSIKSYLKELKTYEESGDKDKILNCYFDIGVKYGLSYNNEKALKYFFLTYNATSETENLKLHINSAANIGRIYYTNGRIEEALEYLFYALKQFKIKSDKLNIAKIFRDIASCYNDLEMFDKSLEYSFKSIDLYESLDKNILLSGAINDSAITYCFLDDYDTALAGFFKALKIQEKEKYFPGIAISENNIGEIYIKLGKFDDALKYFMKAIESYKNEKENYLNYTIYQNIGIVYKALNKYQEALLNFNKALEISTDLSLEKNILETYNEIKKIYYLLGEYKKAYDTQEKSLKLSKDIQFKAQEIEQESISKQINPINSYIDEDNEFGSEIVGNSPEMKEVFSLVNMISEHNVNVLITGPTGCGKELIAKRIHNSFKGSAPFIAINCSAIPEHLLESELFGHTKGAFTGAIKNKKGKFEQATGGTLFLDEIGDMTLSLQAKILRAIQERKVSPIGSTKEISVSVRILSATNKNLEKMIETGAFRGDLFYRLNVIRVNIPALKNHKTDIPALVSHFINKYNQKFNKKILSISANALNYLISCEWHGNIRELENEIEKAVLLSSEEILKTSIFIDPKNNSESPFLKKLPLIWKEYQSYKLDLNNKLDSNYVKVLMESSDNNIQKACVNGKLARTQVYRLLKKTDA